MAKSKPKPAATPAPEPAAEAADGACTHPRAHAVRESVMRCPDCRTRYPDPKAKAPAAPAETDAKGRPLWAAPCPPWPPGHKERCEDRVSELTRTLARAKTQIEQRELRFRLQAAQRRLDHASAQ